MNTFQFGKELLKKMSEYITERKDLVHLQRHLQQSLLDEEYEEKRINHVSFKEKEKEKGKEKELSLSFKKKEEQLMTSLRSLLARVVQRREEIQAVLSVCEKEEKRREMIGLKDLQMRMEEMMLIRYVFYRTFSSSES